MLGLIFLKFADANFAARRAELEKTATGRRGSRVDDPAAYHASGVLYLAPEARYGHLLEFPEGGLRGQSLGQAVDEAMRAIERDNTQLSGVLPKLYQRFKPRPLKELFKKFSIIPDDLEGDAFGKIYEYFLGEFAMSEGQGGGEFYTPTSIVRLLVEVLEPFKGRVLDPACGSGGMFVQSARFVAEHRENRSALSIHGIEKKVARQLLTRVRGILTADWQKTAQTRARMKEQIEEVLDEGLPRAYTPDVFKEKSAVLFQHVYERFGRAA